MTTKPIEFLGDSLDALRSFPIHARREVGFQMDKVQRGGEPDDWKPMRSVGPGVREIRIHDEAGAFRVIYLAKLADAVYVLHCMCCTASRRRQSRRATRTSNWRASASRN